MVVKLTFPEISFTRTFRSSKTTKYRRLEVDLKNEP